MKKAALFLMGLIATIGVVAQTPQGISHQAMIRDAANEPVIHAPIGIRVSILKGGSEGEAVYVETHTPVSNANGLITFVIGAGTAVSGTFSDIDWSDGPFFLQTEADPDGGTGYSISGVTQFFSVPYSMQAAFAGVAHGFSGLDALLARIEALEEALDIEDPEFTCGDNITFTYRGEEVTYGTILRGGLCWMDRNLGASRVPLSLTDSEGYGDLFQWGRLDDGHQDRTSSITIGPFNQDVPGHASFIIAGSEPHDWRSPKNNSLWQGEDGINNPCPPGWRVPTEEELNAERESWDDNNSSGAYASTLKWPVGGYRSFYGELGGVGINGFVWSSSVNASYAQSLVFGSGFDAVFTYYRAFGVSVRCIKDTTDEPNTHILHQEAAP